MIRERILIRDRVSSKSCLYYTYKGCLLLAKITNLSKDYFD